MKMQRILLALVTAGGIAYADPLNAVDRNFMVTAARIDMTEAHKGQMAENQAVRTDIKDFARTSVQDHTESYEHLSELAAKDQVSIPRGINAKGSAIVQLVHLKGDRFDRQFVREEVAADQQALAIFKREATRGHDTDVKAYAAKTIPVLENELRLAQGCAKTSKRT